VTPRRARTALLGIFVGCLVLQCAVLILNRSAVGPEEFTASLLTLLKIYSVPLRLSWAAPSRGGAGGASPAVCWAAILLAVSWNVLLVARTLAFGIATEDSVSDLIKYLEMVSAAASFLVAGMLAFFFGKSAK
jgi:hypothetical protein